MDQYQTPPQPSGQQSVLAIVSMVLGIISLLLVCCTFFDLPLVLGAIICGHLGLKDAADNGKSGGGMAKAGLIMGYVALVLVIVLIVLSFAMPDAPTDWEEFLEQIQNPEAVPTEGSESIVEPAPSPAGE